MSAFKTLCGQGMTISKQDNKKERKERKKKKRIIVAKHSPVINIIIIKQTPLKHTHMPNFRRITHTHECIKQIQQYPSMVVPPLQQGNVADHVFDMSDTDVVF